MARRRGVGMVIIVPAFAEGDQSHPPVVARVVARSEATSAPHVSGGVDQPRGVESKDDTEETSPEQEGESADQVQDDGECHVRYPVIVVEPDVETILRQIGGVL